MKILIHIVLSTWLFSSFVAHAQSFGAQAPDIGAGKKRAAVCFSCHGVNGISKILGTPHLAGQDRTYIENALRAYRDGQTRQNATMNAMAKPLSDLDIVNIAAYFSLQTRMNNGQTAAQTLEMIERIRPVAVVKVMEDVTVNSGSGANTASGASAASVRSGESVYQSSCMACHSTGVAGAPKLGDKAAWAPRISAGNSTMIQHALQGFKGMPAKGGCANCLDAEIKAAVEYLTSRAK